MTRRHLLGLLLVLPTAGPCAAAGLPRVPVGYEVEIVAESPLVEHPMMADFDDRGRLFVAESAGTNRKAQELIDEPLDLIRMLTDTDGDGSFDQSKVFADKLTFPQGVLCYQGAVYTCAPPHVWRLEDTDGDGICDKRSVLVESFGFNGNAASIHGPFLGPDERLYWCDGRHGHEFFDESGQLVSKGKAARIFSCRPDGSDVRTVCGGGMDNPVEVDWLPTGEMLGTVNLFYGRPRGDVLVHWIEGGVYPRLDQQDCIDEFTWTGGVLPEIHNYGHVAVSGMCRERFRRISDVADSRGEDGDAVASFLVTQFNTHKVVRTVLKRSGSTFATTAEEDFVVWNDPDVHPTDVLEDDEGSVLVVDTGGWFRIGCPTSQIAKPEISGAIYRIRATHEAPPRERENDAVAIVPRTVDEARHWLSIGDAPQQLAAAQFIAQQAGSATGDLGQPLRTQLSSALIETISQASPDRHLSHAIILALIRLNIPDVARAALEDKSARVQRAALIALDQMQDGKLSENDVVDLLQTEDDNLQQTALTVISRHDGWVAETVPMFREWLLERAPDRRRIEAMRAFFTSQEDDLWVQELVADALAQPKTHPAIRQMVIDVIARTQLSPLPPLWGDGLSVPLGLRNDPQSRLAAIRTIGMLGLDQHDGWLREIYENPYESPSDRIEAMTAAAARMHAFPERMFEFAMKYLTESDDLLLKLALARGLTEAPLTETQLVRLANAFAKAGPSVVPILLPGFKGATQESVGTALVQGLTDVGNGLSVSVVDVSGLLEQYPEAVQRQARPLIEHLQSDHAERAGRLDQLLESTSTGGDPGRGRALFFSKQAGCSVCHHVGDTGGEIGPALTNIGEIRQRRDLLEAIVFPSASFAREYRPFVIVTVDGHVHTGIIQSRTSDLVTLQTPDLRAIHIPRRSIEVMEPSDISIMPKGLDERLSHAELADLLAYLESLHGAQ